MKVDLAELIDQAMEVLSHCGSEFRGQGTLAGKTAVVGEIGYTQAGKEGPGVLIADEGRHVENVGEENIGGLRAHPVELAEFIPQLGAIVPANSGVIIVTVLQPAQDADQGTALVTIEARWSDKVV